MSFSKIAIGLLLVAVLAGGLIVRVVLTRNEGDSHSLRLSGNIEVTDAEMSFKIPGRVEKRPIDEGQIVKQGALIAVLDTSDLEAEVAGRRAELEAIQAALAELKAGSREEEKQSARATMEKASAYLAELRAGSRPQEIDAAKATLDSAEVDMRRLEEELRRANQLYNNRAIAIEEYNRQKAAYEVATAKFREARQRCDLVKIGPREEQKTQAEAALAQATAQYRLVMAGPRHEQIDQAAARVEQARAALNLVKTRLGYATLLSPMDGVVLSKSIEPGEYVSAGTPVVTVGDLKNIWLRAYIEGPDLDRVKYGQEALVTTDSKPGKTYRGRVSFIAQEAEFTPKTVQTEKERTRLVYRIKIDIDNPNMELKRGMPADAVLTLDAPTPSSDGATAAK